RSGVRSTTRDGWDAVRRVRRLRRLLGQGRDPSPPRRCVLPSPPYNSGGGRHRTRRAPYGPRRGPRNRERGGHVDRHVLVGWIAESPTRTVRTGAWRSTTDRDRIGPQYHRVHRRPREPMGGGLLAQP